MTGFDGADGAEPETGDGGPADSAGSAGYTGPRDFRLLTPANWYVLDLRPATRGASIARLVEQRFGATDDPRLVQARRELTALLRGAAREAEDNGAIYAALMDTLVEDVALSASLIAVVGPAPVDDDGNVVTDPAALTATLLAGELAAALDTATGPAETGGPSTVDLTGTGTPAGAAAGTPAGAAANGQAAGTGGTEIVELPAGPAVRLRRVTDSGVAGSTGETARAAETQYFLSIPDTDRMLALTFATPNVEFAPQFEELFDRIAETLEWQWAGPA